MHADGLSLGGRTPYEPVGVDARYAPPRAWIDPDRAKGWIRRLRPVLATHRVLLGIGVGASIVALVAQVAIPAVSRGAIDDALVERTDDARPVRVGAARPRRRPRAC